MPDEPTGDTGTTGEPAGSDPAPGQDPTTPVQGTPPPETTFTQADVERIVSERLTRERKKYADYADLKQQATKAKTAEQRLAELEQAITERDKQYRDQQSQLAVAQVHAKLAQAGFNASDVAGLLDLIDASALLDEGRPNLKAIDKLAASLIKVGGRSTPDPDQGKRGGQPPVNMNQLIRNKAGISAS